MVALSASHFACAAETTDDSGTGGTGTGGIASGVGGSTIGAGGTTTGAGGTTTGAGGSITASGGSTGAGGGGTTLPNPTLTPSTFATDGYGDSDPFKGYVFTYAFGGGAINPPCGVSGPCFTGANVCAAGTIPASTEAGAAIGFNVNQLAEETTAGNWTSTGTGVIVDTERAPAGTRVQIKSGTTDYCAVATDGVAIPWTSFKTECWGTEGTAFTVGSPVTAVEVVVPGTEAAQTFDFCVIDVNLAP